MIPSFRTTAAALLIAALAAGACGKKPPVATPAPPPPPPAEKPATTPPPPPAPAPPAPTPPAPEAPPKEETLESLTKDRVLKPAYFAYDSIVLSEEARGVLQKNADYLKKRTTAKVMVEGHADSRGTNEYNLALTDRRAGAVKAYLVSLGISADRVTTVAKGEEQPFCREETEACWQENRVGFFVFTAK